MLGASICFFVHWFFFFSSRRRHTRWPRDWSSDVCSSDLEVLRLWLGERRFLGKIHSVQHFLFNALYNFVHFVIGKDFLLRSEERRVGKECSSRWMRKH